MATIFMSPNLEFAGLTKFRPPNSGRIPGMPPAKKASAATECKFKTHRTCTSQIARPAEQLRICLLVKSQARQNLRLEKHAAFLIPMLRRRSCFPTLAMLNLHLGISDINPLVRGPCPSARLLRIGHIFAYTQGTEQSHAHGIIQLPTI